MQCPWVPHGTCTSCSSADFCSSVRCERRALWADDGWMVWSTRIFWGKYYTFPWVKKHTGGIWIDILILSWSTSEVVSIGFIWITSLCSRLYFISSSIRVPRRRATPTFHPNWKHSITPSQVKCLFFESDFRSFSMCFHLAMIMQASRVPVASYPRNPLWWPNWFSDAKKELFWRRRGCFQRLRGDKDEAASGRGLPSYWWM